jgi:putative transcriptional regulator
MIRFRLKELVADKEFREGRRVSMEEISSATGIHRTTLSRIANQKGYNATTEVLDKLCAFFQVSIDKIAEYIEDTKE